MIWLKHYHYDIFQPFILHDERFDDGEENAFRIQFLTGINGDIESLNMIGFEASTITLNFKKTVKEKAITKNELEQYVGVFEIAGTEVKFYTRGNSLYMFVTGQPEYELIAVDKDKFSAKSLSGYAIQFLRDSQDKVNAVNLIQPNGTFKAIKK
jgi:hypothetical protein